MGHGALFLGHAHPQITQAVVEQAQKGTHYGASHRLELEWGKLVRQLVPSAEEVRFTSSGTEAPLMAVRLARAYTGRDKLLKFDGHFHGWHDSVVGVRYGESDHVRWPGGPGATSSNTLSVPQGDIHQVESRLDEGDVAAVILEPTGPHWGALPLAPDFLRDLREATSRHNTVLIFDEVVTGFRVSPGGAQALYGVTPDLTTLAKILAGGLPGAGVAMLSLVESGGFHPRAGAPNAKLIRGLNRVLEQRDIPGAAYGLSSYFHLTLGTDCPRPQDGIEWPHRNGRMPPQMSSELALTVRPAMLNHGVDFMAGRTGHVSGVHTAAGADPTPP